MDDSSPGGFVQARSLRENAHAQQSLEELLWGGAEVYERELKREEERYEASGQLDKCLQLVAAAGESQYRRRQRGGWRPWQVGHFDGLHRKLTH